MYNNVNDKWICYQCDGVFVYKDGMSIKYIYNIIERSSDRGEEERYGSDEREGFLLEIMRMVRRVCVYVWLKEATSMQPKLYAPKTPPENEYNVRLDLNI